jgi:hypothetical protein
LDCESSTALGLWDAVACSTMEIAESNDQTKIAKWKRWDNKGCLTSMCCEASMMDKAAQY